MGAIIQAADGRLVAISRTQKALAYEAFLSHVRNELSGMTRDQQLRAAKANAEFLRGLHNPRHQASHEAEQRAVTPGMVHVDTIMASMSVRYGNDDYIGERIMPVATVNYRSNKFVKYDKRDGFSYPDDEIGYRSSPNELEQGRTTDNYSVKDYGYKEYLDLETVQNQDAPLNEMVEVHANLLNGIAFRREKRILAIAGNSANYGGNTAPAGTNWNDVTGGSIIDDLLAASAAIWTGPTPTRKLGFTTLSVWNSGVANNPRLRELFKYTGGGLTTTQLFAQFFGLDDIVIAQAREDTANIGQTASYARMMTGDVFGVVAVSPNPSTRSLHWGTTFRMAGDPFSTQWPDPGIGKRGGIWDRVSVSEDHKAIVPEAGFLITSILT